MIGYATGLMMANTAVYLMQMGQPALLYLVPCTLGVFLALTHREGTLAMMWRGPPSLTGICQPSPTQLHAASNGTAGANDIENEGLLDDDDGPSCELRDMSQHASATEPSKQGP